MILLKFLPDGHSCFSDVANAQGPTEGSKLVLFPPVEDAVCHLRALSFNSVFMVPDDPQPEPSEIPRPSLIAVTSLLR